MKKINDEIKIVVDRGRFDNYCVYIEKNLERTAPRDVDYFDYFIQLAHHFPTNNVYNDILDIFNDTTAEYESTILDRITEISHNYGTESTNMNIWLTVLYLGFVAEENKAWTKLGKNIKMLGIYQIFFQKFTALEAANYSKGRSANFLISECRRCGFLENEPI